VTKVRVVPKEHWDIIQKYLYNSDGALILIPEETISKYSEEEAKLLRKADEQDINYDFGGEANHWVDIACVDGYCTDIILDRMRHLQDTNNETTKTMQT
jgi:hypothetical protein